MSNTQKPKTTTLMFLRRKNKKYEETHRITTEWNNNVTKSNDVNTDYNEYSIQRFGITILAFIVLSFGVKYTYIFVYILIKK